MVGDDDDDDRVYSLTVTCNSKVTTNAQPHDGLSLAWRKKENFSNVIIE